VPRDWAIPGDDQTAPTAPENEARFGETFRAQLDEVHSILQAKWERLEAETRSRQAMAVLAEESARRVADLEEQLRVGHAAAAAAYREQASTAAALEELREAIAELRSSSAVRAAEMLRAASPGLHRRLGRVLRLIFRAERNG
jgi:hypothetical protein